MPTIKQIQSVMQFDTRAFVHDQMDKYGITGSISQSDINAMRSSIDEAISEMLYELVNEGDIRKADLDKAMHREYINDNRKY